ncbi:Mannan polymerase II complex anp1 subunit [Friedmanniomyces endolithicus]|nr:Mannan polymerase II complex anp1 subunit [Friedmanniomyces endolithicus]
MEMEIDGVGGVSILAKAKVFRSGVHFPAFSFEKHAETEGFGKMAKRMGYSVVGLPHYTIWHLYEPSVDDIRHMEEMEQERKAREAEERERREREEKIGRVFDTEGREQWEKDRKAVEDAQKAEKETQRVRDNAEAKAAEEPERRKANGEGVVGAGGREGAKDVTADPTPEIPTQSSSPSAEQPKLPTDANKPAAEAKLSNDDPSADAGSSGKSITPSKAPTDTEERLASMAQQEEGGKAANVDKPATEAKEKGGKRMDELEHDMRGPVGAS